MAVGGVVGWWVGVELEKQEGYRPQNSGSSVPSPPDQTSDYPVILSLENHCSREQQEIIVHHLTEILGDQLLTTALDGQLPTQLPSPEVGTLPFQPRLPYRPWLFLPGPPVPFFSPLDGPSCSLIFLETTLIFKKSNSGCSHVA